MIHFVDALTIFPSFSHKQTFFYKIRKDKAIVACLAIPILVFPSFSTQFRSLKQANLMTGEKRNHPLNKNNTEANAVFFSEKPW